MPCSNARARTQLTAHQRACVCVPAQEGGGAKPAKGSLCEVHCTGYVTETGKKFWSTKDAGQTTFSFKVRHTSTLHGPPPVVLVCPDFVLAMTRVVWWRHRLDWAR